MYIHTSTCTYKYVYTYILVSLQMRNAKSSSDVSIINQSSTKEVSLYVYAYQAHTVTQTRVHTRMHACTHARTHTHMYFQLFFLGCRSQKVLTLQSLAPTTLCHPVIKSFGVQSQVPWNPTCNHDNLLLWQLICPAVTVYMYCKYMYIDSSS